MDQRYPTMIRIAIWTFIISAVAGKAATHYSIEKYYLVIALIVFGGIMYVANVFLIKYYIEKRAPEFATSEEIASGLQQWEATAGMQIVPKWVSLIGILSVSTFMSALLPVIIYALKFIVRIVI